MNLVIILTLKDGVDLLQQDPAGVEWLAVLLVDMSKQPSSWAALWLVRRNLWHHHFQMSLGFKLVRGANTKKNLWWNNRNCSNFLNSRIYGGKYIKGANSQNADILLSNGYWGKELPITTHLQSVTSNLCSISILGRAKEWRDAVRTLTSPKGFWSQARRSAGIVILSPDENVRIGRLCKNPWITFSDSITTTFMSNANIFKIVTCYNIHIMERYVYTVPTRKVLTVFWKRSVPNTQSL